MAIGTPANTLAGASVAPTAQTYSIPAVTAGNIIVLTSYGRRGSTTLAPDDPTLVDSSAVPLAWTKVFSTQPVQVGANPGIKGNWWWGRADGAAKTVTVTWPNSSATPAVFGSAMSFTIGAGMNPSFTNQIWGGAVGAIITVTLPTTPTTGINFLSYYGAGGSTSTIASGFTSLTNIASTPYRTGYDLTPIAATTMGSASFPDAILLVANIVEVAQATSRLGKIWNGSAWVVKPVKVWSGSAWVAKPSKIWNGSAWV